MKLIIDNQLTLLNIPDDLKEWFIGKLTFNNPVYDEAVKHGRYLRNIPEHIKLYRDLPLGISIPRGYLQIVENYMVGQGVGLSIQDNRIITDLISVKSDIKLRPYQDKAKYDLLAHANGMLVAPAASGKTVMGLDIFASVHQKMLWLTHTNRLIQQVIERITDMFSDVQKEEIGVIGGGKFDIGDRITVGMIPTLVRREAMLPEIGREFGLVIVDEAHHVPASTFIKVIGHFSSYYLYGLTATPYRRDKLEKMMFATMGLPNAVVERSEVRRMGGIITPSVIKRVVPSPKFDGNDFHYIIKELVLPNERRLSMIVGDISAEARNGNYCIVINTRKQYCEMIFERLVVTWPKTVIATGDYSRKHNDEQILKIDNDEATVLITTFELLGEGFDVKKLNRGFLALPFRERARVEQSIGRIQRTCEGKTDAIMYDYVDENIGILENQFLHRSLVYKSLGMKMHE